MSSAEDDEINTENDPNIFEDDFEKDLLAEELLVDEGVDELLDDLLSDEKAKRGNEADEKLLRFAVSEDRESKASQLRLRTKDIDEGQLEIAKPEAVNVEDDWKGMSEKPKLNRFLVSLGGFVLLVLIAGVAWAVIEMKEGEEVVELEERETEEAKDLEVREDLEMMEELCRAYLAADNIEDKRKTVSYPEKVDAMMKDYYSRHDFSPQKVKEIDIVLSSDSDFRVFWIVSCTLEGEVEPKSLVVSQSDSGKFGVIWELDVVYQPVPWEAFIEKEVTELTPFRVTVLAKAKSGYYGYEFADYKKYRCFKLKVPGSEKYLWGYTEAGSATDNELVARYKESSKKIQTKEGFPMILGLRYMENSMSNQCVLIDRFFGNDWKVK